MTQQRESIRDIGRYQPVGLLANPFFDSVGKDDAALDCEMQSEGFELLSRIYQSSREASPKPIWVGKADLPGSYTMNAIGATESFLAVDKTLNVLFAYIQLYTMKIGVVRATLSVLSERLVFRDFEGTLAAFVGSVVDQPDTDLPSYQLLGPDRLAAFQERFAQSDRDAIREVFGQAELERHPELSAIADIRQRDLESDVADETEVTAEIDETVGDAPGTIDILGLGTHSEPVDPDALAVRDYLIDYTRAHLSPVVARVMRVYSDRGLAAAAEEFKITKAPKKTLRALVDFARHSYGKIVLIYDQFENWGDIDPELRSGIVGTLSELRWKLADDAFPVFLVEEGAAPELEESLGNGPRLTWDFTNAYRVIEDLDRIDSQAIDSWFARCADPGAEPLTSSDPVIAGLIQDAEGSFRRFIAMAAEAVEDAADRGVRLDQAAREAGNRVVEVEQQ